MMKDMNSSNNNQVLEFDIDKLPNHKLRQLERYVNESLINSGKTPHRVKAARDRAAQRKKAAQGKTTQKRDVSPHGKMVAEPRKHVKMTGESSSSGDEKGRKRELYRWCRSWIEGYECSGSGCCNVSGQGERRSDASDVADGLHGP